MTEAVPWRSVALAPVDVRGTTAADGSLVLESRADLQPAPRHLVEVVRGWAERDPDRIAFAERDRAGDWRTLTYAGLVSSADAIAQALLDRGLGSDDAVAILSGSSIAHAQLTIGAMTAGVPVAPVSPAYSQSATDFAKLRAVLDQTGPRLVYVDDVAAFATALDQMPDGTEVVARRTGGGDVTPLDQLLHTAPTADVERALAEQGPEHVAKILFTSGSTGSPKGVPTTQRMLCTNQQQLLQVWPFLAQQPPVLVDWLPWNHTFGGSNNVGMVLFNGGTLHIDDGRPTPAAFERTIRNLADVRPTVYANVPAGLGMLVAALERDADLAARFFERLQIIVYAAASLPEHVWDRLQDLAVATVGERIVMVTAWGSTETAPMATMAHYPTERPGNIGVPVPGVRVKLVPHEERHELRVAGPSVMSGYHRKPDLDEQVFDEDGYYRIGDAGRLVDPDDPAQGLRFDGRLSEEFKLTTGTFVHVGQLRTRLLSVCPLLTDAVIVGPGRDELTLLAWVDADAVAELAPELAGADAETLVADPRVRAAVLEQITAHNEAHPASSTRFARVALQAEPPSIDAGEVTDKGYLNQRGVLDRRHAVVERLYADQPDHDILVVPQPTLATR